MNQHSEDLSFPLKPQKIIWDLRAAMAIDDIVICDLGAHKLWMARMFRCELPNTCLISMALPAWASQHPVHPQQAIVAVTGDAGFMMNSQEI